MPKPFSFEVKETDLMGRVGVMKVGERASRPHALHP